MDATNITDARRCSFNAMVSGEYDNFVLFSCFLDDKPTSAIAAVTPDGEDYIITPLFVAVTDDMRLTDHDGRDWQRR